MLRSKRPEDKESGARGSISPDTIAAIITPPGEGGIAAVRLAGTRSVDLLEKHFRPITKSAPKPFLMRLGHFLDPDGVTIDEVTAVYMPQGKSYTGQEQVEIFCHGGRMVVELILNELLASGARVAEPGEFTKLAFLAGRIDLTQAEGVASVISANTSLSHTVAREHLLGAYTAEIGALREQITSLMAEFEASIDFAEDIEPAGMDCTVESLNALRERLTGLVKTYVAGRLLKEGYKVAIAGAPNAGKSSLFNRLLRRRRALVTRTAGTTRDYLSEWLDVGGFPVNLIDTAGLRSGGGQIEQASHKAARKVIDSADLILWVVDLSRRDWKQSLKEFTGHLASNRIIMIGNKIDLIHKVPRILPPLTMENTLCVSCQTGKGLKALKKAILTRMQLRMPDLTSGLVVTSARHRQKLDLAATALKSATEQVRQGESPEIVAFTLHQAITPLDEITGRIYNEEILGEIFSRFCVGK
ncbi:MAG: tRNA uridine-5-carboxymethylaminomethyl(34) synthesis GTPase MnmE [candidate division Zixibacteria bacterium]|nr:tRNA uridine-5-carboxymethylaminomethyl(34) synthesis GTPase MnmE [candidate division Zixibacteria bacterium]